MKTYKATRTYTTGLRASWNPPHTIEFENGRRISIVYYDEKYIGLPYVADAITDDGKLYKLYINEDGTRALARPYDA